MKHFEMRISGYRFSLTFLFILSSVVKVAPCRGETLSQSPPQTILFFILGISANGTATSSWREAIRDRHAASELNNILAGEKIFSEEEMQWAKLIESKVTSWRGMIDSLRIPFENVAPPDSVFILLGNRGGSDAFTHAPRTICFDLSQLQQFYGPATSSENHSRIDRFFAHEFTHIMHKAWRSARGVDFNSPFEFALWECLTEGLGNYRSLSGKYINEEKGLTPHAQRVLQSLQPIFVERLAAIAHASAAEAEVLMKGLSSGAFEKKWGALTTALWLAQEARGDDGKLRAWVEAGPHGVLRLAEKYLPDELQAQMPKHELK